MFPTSDDVAAFVGKPEDDGTIELADVHLPFVTATVRAYTRDRGFGETGDMSDDLAPVVIASTARLLGDPQHTIERTVGPFSERAAIFNGWTLPELAILHRYRRRAQ